MAAEDPEKFAVETAPASWRWLTSLALVTLSALALRFFAIERHSFWYDEAFTAARIEAPYLDLFRGTARDNGNPPLYWILAKAWSGMFGDSEFALRSLSALLGSMTVPLLGLLGRRVVGRASGLIAAGLLAVSPMALELSNEARAYALVGLLSVASTYFFAEWVVWLRARDLVLYTISVTLAIYSHYFAMALPLAHATSLGLLPRRRVRDLGWVLASASALLLWTPWLPAFFDQVRSPGNLSRLGDSWQLQFLATPLVFGFGRSLVWRDSGVAALGAATVASLIAYWVPCLLGLLCLRRRLAVVGLLTTWAFVPVVAPLLVAITLTPIYMTRYAYLGLPGFLLAVAVGLCYCRPWARRLAVCVILAGTSLSIYRYATSPLKDDWRSASASIRARIRGDEVVVTDPDIEVRPFLYYARRSGLPFSRESTLTLPGPKLSGRVAVVRLRDSRRGGVVDGDFAGEIRQTSGVWLALRRSETPPETYIAYFRQSGFVMVDRLHFHQIDLLYFARSPHNSTLLHNQ